MRGRGRTPRKDTKLVDVGFSSEAAANEHRERLFRVVKSAIGLVGDPLYVPKWDRYINTELTPYTQQKKVLQETVKAMWVKVGNVYERLLVVHHSFSCRTLPCMC